jgi:hypothetical protein
LPVNVWNIIEQRRAESRSIVDELGTGDVQKQTEPFTTEFTEITEKQILRFRIFGALCVVGGELSSQKLKAARRRP